MIWIVISLTVLLVAETAFFFWGFGDGLNPSKTELVEEHWYDFLEWCSKPKNFAGMGGQYETYNVPNNSGTPVRTPIPNENNFWFWLLEYKYGDIKRGNTKSKRGTAS